MKIDTNTYRDIAYQLARYSQMNPALKKRETLYRQGTIQSRLYALSNYFLNSSNLVEIQEQKMRDGIFKPGYSNVSSWMKPNVSNLIKKEGTVANGVISINAAYRQCRLSHANRLASAYLDADVGKFKARGETKFSLYKDQKLDPQAAIKAEASLSLLSGTIGARLGNSQIYGKAVARGTVGTAYTKCKAVLSSHEQTLDIGVGASALKGEVEASFNFFGAKVSLTGSGSIGSAEANLTYHHSAKEWEFGSKLGFIAGLGFKVKVEY